jgi:hypothetical protein
MIKKPCGFYKADTGQLFPCVGQTHECGSHVMCVEGWQNCPYGKKSPHYEEWDRRRDED